MQYDNDLVVPKVLCEVDMSHWPVTAKISQNCHSPKFFMSLDPLNIPAKFESPALAVPEIIAIAVFGWGCETPNLEEGGAVEGRGWYRSKERW